MAKREQRSGSKGPPDWRDLSCEKFRRLSHQILEYGSRGTPRLDFLRQVLEILIVRSGADVGEIRLIEGGRRFRGRYTRMEGAFWVDTVPLGKNEERGVLCHSDDPTFNRLCLAVVDGLSDSDSPCITERGSLWIADVTQPFRLRLGPDSVPWEGTITMTDGSRSIVLFPLTIQDERVGVLHLASGKPGYFTRDIVEFYEAVAGTLAVSLAYRWVQVALRERVKELTCLYGISRLVEQPGISLPEILQGVAGLLPSGWLYPEVASAGVVLDGRVHSTPDFPEEGPRQRAEIVIDGRRRGFIDVAYREPKPELEEGPFLKEERHLINTVATELALIIERKQAEEDKSKMEEQLRHADRLATIGQLAEKCPGLPKQAGDDLQKIVSAALHAREIIRKLMIFARKMPPQKIWLDLNQVIEDGLYFLEARCARAGIRLVRSLAPDLPRVMADPAQVHQVLVNLVVNSIQAMTEGGQLTLETRTLENGVALVVEDTGQGMTGDVLNQIFVPFFTTKDVDLGTGLGLPVVHGIVSSHGGSIRVESRPCEGTRVEVRLPVREPNQSGGNHSDDTVG